MAVQFLENYMVLRKAPTTRALSLRAGLEVVSPANPTERSYRDLLEEANRNYFHREYGIALSNYLELRHVILVQSHPEMPVAPGKWGLLDIDFSAVAFDRVAELSRRYYEITPPGRPVNPKLDFDPVVNPGEFDANPALAKFASLGIDAAVRPVSEAVALRERGRMEVRRGALEDATALYQRAHDAALVSGEFALAAESLNEAAVMMATYAPPAERTDSLAVAAESLQGAVSLFALAGDRTGQNAATANLASISEEMGNDRDAAKGRSSIPSDFVLRLESTGRTLGVDQLAVEPPKQSRPRLKGFLVPRPQTRHEYLMAEDGSWDLVTAKIAARPEPTRRRVGILRNPSVKEISIAKANFQGELATNLYEPRKTATTLAGIDFFEELWPNFVAYIPHLYFFVLPVAIGDTYMALGQYQSALNEYATAAKYTFINKEIESPYLWMQMAKANLRWGDELFRREEPAAAKARYEQIVKTDLSVPAESPLYSGSAMTPLKAIVGEAIKQIKGEEHAPVNSKIVELVAKAHLQLQKIGANLNFLGLGQDHYPVLKFKYLQSVATYMADNAIQAERTFINFRQAAENQKLERMQLENDLVTKQSLAAMEAKRMQDAALEVEYATKAEQYASQRKQHADEAVEEWDTKGREVARMNATLAWASAAANDQKIKVGGVDYRGETHSFETDVEQFYDIVTDWREQLNWEMQNARLERQADELKSEIALAKTRKQQALVRQELQQMSVNLANLRVDGAQDLLDYSSERMFDEDLWFQLAGELQDLAREYLDMAIYAAFLMERAYDLEFDRDLGRIRFDYGVGGPEGLLGGDHLKRDISSFNLDYLEHAQKQNPLRLLISLRDSFPGEFDTFVNEGILPFRTDLELFDRSFPGTYGRKLKKLEVFVEGLVPPEGICGTLLHQGISTEWRRSGANWAKHTRVMPADTMVLSSYDYRRDVMVFQPREELLGQFENLGPEGNWTLELPQSANDLDYRAITDVKLALYFDANYSEDLRAHVRATYPDAGGKLLRLSSRFHFPDQYFLLDRERAVSFELHYSRFPYNQAKLALTSFAVQVVGKAGEPLSGVDLEVHRISDDSSAAGTTDAAGVVSSNAGTMAPFAAWKGDSPIDEFRVEFADGVDTTQIGDVILALGYSFAYRPDGSLGP